MEPWRVEITEKPPGCTVAPRLSRVHQPCLALVFCRILETQRGAPSDCARPVTECLEKEVALLTKIDVIVVSKYRIMENPTGTRRVDTCVGLIRHPK